MDPSLLLAGGSIISGALGAESAEDAAEEMASATREAGEMQLTGMREALAAQENMFNFGLGASAPQRSMGTAALGAMSGMLGLGLPEVDQHDYAADIAGAQKGLDELKARKKKFSSAEASGAKLGDADYGRWEALGKQIKDRQNRIKQAKRGMEEQSLQRRALEQFQSGQGGGTGGGGAFSPIQAFNFDFDASQLGETDSYKFRQEQSLEALDRRLAAGGMRGSGNRYSGILELASGMASQEYEAEYGRQYGRARDAYSSQFDIYNLYAGMSGMGGVDLQTASGVGGNMAGIIQQGYGGMSNALMAGGEANAAGIMGQANATRGMFQDLAYIGGRAGWFDE